MSVFNRIAGSEEPKIPVWPLMTNFSRLVDGEINMQTLAGLHDLDVGEVTELTTYLQTLGARIQVFSTALVTSGVDQAVASELARAIVTSRTFPLLLRIEQGTITEQQFRQKIGLS